MPAGINSAVSPLTVQTCVHCTLLRTRRDITLCLHCEVHKSENHQRWFKPTHLPQRKPEPRSAWARIHSAGDQRKRRGGVGHHLATSVLRRVTHSHMPLDAEHRKQHTDPFPTSGSSTPQPGRHCAEAGHPPNASWRRAKEGGAGEVVPQVPWAAINHPSP